VSTRLPAILLLVALLAGCGNAGPADNDRVATRVAEALAATQAVANAAATLVAGTQVAGATAATAAPSLPTRSPEATLTLPSEPPTSTPAPLVPLPTDTPVPPPPPPTDTPVPPPPPLPIAAVFPYAGNTQGLDGRVLIPGYSAPPEVFRDTLAFRVQVSDPTVGQADGDGIVQVEFRIDRVDANGNQETVYETTETTAPYCMFSGNDPACRPINLVSGATWPNGELITSGQYAAQIAIIGVNDNTRADWNFDFLVELR